MLPPGFEWHPRTDTWALHVNDRLAAMCIPVPNGKCRIETGLGLRSHHIIFQPSLDHGLAYVEAWARKWEAEIRAAYSVAPSLGWPRPPGAADRRAHTAADGAS